MKGVLLVTAALLGAGCVSTLPKPPSSQATVTNVSEAPLRSMQAFGANRNTHVGEEEMSAEGNFQLLIPETMPKSVGYSQVAIVRGGLIVFIAGQVALDKAGSVVGKDDFHAQVQQVFENLKFALESAGGSFKDVIKLNSYFIDLGNAPDFRKVRDQYINVEKPPASTAVQVPRLFRPEFLIEIEATAVVKDR
jgi:enamine deaminase RidA (YjgF/YER057c/UK114 family)